MKKQSGAKAEKAIGDRRMTGGLWLPFTTWAAGFGGRHHVVIHHVVMPCFSALAQSCFSAFGLCFFVALAPPHLFGLWLTL
jgi:hypothetical protein